MILWRAGHALITVLFLSSIGYVWWCALSGRRGRLLTVAITALLGEGVFVGLNHGDCPLGPLGDRLGDPVPLFELILSPRAAKRAIPVLGGVAAAGITLVGARSRTRAPREGATPGERVIADDLAPFFDASDEVAVANDASPSAAHTRRQ